MNDKAKKKARKAELEDYLLEKFYKVDHGYMGGFGDWLEFQTGEKYRGWHSEAAELIAIYEGE